MTTASDGLQNLFDEKDPTRIFRSKDLLEHSFVEAKTWCDFVVGNVLIKEFLVKSTHRSESSSQFKFVDLLEEHVVPELLNCAYSCEYPVAPFVLERLMTMLAHVSNAKTYEAATKQH